MLKGMWNYAVKVKNLDKAVDFYTKNLEAELKMAGEVLGSRYRLIRMGNTRVLIFDKAPYEDALKLNLPEGFLHVVYEVDNVDTYVTRLKQAGVNFFVEPRIISTDFGERKITFFEAPGGIRTEVMQIRTEAGNT
ncbi:MAG: VOC family protein [Spirochaetota bacterium]